ncbi:MAG: sigma-70 family RNA polymerase sigma factor [Gammaproteobacteria bacterium]|nr:sigma-70 family RNA polymerase sigma factor [Gammaproteobacteria bacterium]
MPNVYSTAAGVLPGWHGLCLRRVFAMNPPIVIDLSMSDAGERVETFNALYVEQERSFVGIASRNVSRHWNNSLGSLEPEDVAHDSYISVRRRIAASPISEVFWPLCYFSKVCCHKVRREVSKRTKERANFGGFALALAATSAQVANAVSVGPAQLLAELAGHIGSCLTPPEQRLLAAIVPYLVLGEGHQEIAQMVGCSTKTIQRLLKRVKTLGTDQKD